jgi:hypothetical protein
MVLFLGEVWHGGACFKDNGLNFMCGICLRMSVLLRRRFLGCFCLVEI